MGDEEIVHYGGGSVSDDYDTLLPDVWDSSTYSWGSLHDHAIVQWGMENIVRTKSRAIGSLVEKL